jgi:hypothetical protein
MISKELSREDRRRERREERQERRDYELVSSDMAGVNSLMPQR